MENYLDKVIDIIKNIDTENILDVSPDVVTKVIEEQKTYYWIRVYLKDENPNIEIGELKSANKAIADRCNRLEKEKNEAVNKLGEVISKDLFLQAIAAVNGKILK